MTSLAAVQVRQFLESLPVDAALEKRAQAQTEEALTAAGFEFTREHRLNDKDIIDFVVKVSGVRIGVELKTRAQRMSIYRQLERYAMHDSIDALVLFTGTAMTLPDSIKGKPAVVASLGRGWL